jgi:hypothetical protein
LFAVDQDGRDFPECYTSSVGGFDHRAKVHFQVLGEKWDFGERSGKVGSLRFNFYGGDDNAFGKCGGLVGIYGDF